MDANAVFREALALSDGDRMVLIEKLLETFDEHSESADDEAYEAELLRRGREVQEGTADLIPWSELKGRTE